MGSVLDFVDKKSNITHIVGGDKFSRGSTRSIALNSNTVVLERRIICLGDNEIPNINN
jgi:hypothetical protein